MDLEIVILTEVSQTEKCNSHSANVLSLLFPILTSAKLFRYINKYIFGGIYVLGESLIHF